MPNQPIDLVEHTQEATKIVAIFIAGTGLAQRQFQLAAQFFAFWKVPQGERRFSDTV
jgi:hypothetical protein